MLAGILYFLCNIILYKLSLTFIFVHIFSKGPPGFPGSKGEAGSSCQAQQQYYSGTLVVRHSQTTIAPRCEFGHSVLWEGYSLLYVEGNEKAHHQDLGKYI